MPKRRNKLRQSGGRKQQVLSFQHNMPSVSPRFQHTLSYYLHTCQPVMIQI
jgi:hypothetical protein